MTSDLYTLAESLDEVEIGRELHALVAQLYPICRSITDDGVRETLRILGEHVPIEITEVPSGTPVFDWHVPCLSGCHPQPLHLGCCHFPE